MPGMLPDVSSRRLEDYESRASLTQIGSTKISKALYARPARNILKRATHLLVASSVTITTLSHTTPAAAQGLPLIRDAEIEELLADYSRPIFQAAGLGGQRIKMRIIRSHVFNAFVADGRNVFMNTGTLMQSDTPNQVIGVIAHETGHISGSHIAQLRKRVAQDVTKSLLIKILGIGLMVAGGLAGGGDGLGQAGRGVMLGGDSLVMRSLLANRRNQEAAADQAGLHYLTATRQSGVGMLQTFERFARQEYISDRHKDPFVRSHPVATDRLARLRGRVSASPYFNTRDTARLQLRHDLMRAKLSGYLEAPRHVLNRYRGKTGLPAQLARAIAHNCSGNCASHISEIDTLIRAQPNNPYFWELKGSLLRKGGKIRQAVAPLRRAVKLSRNRSPLIKVELAQALVALKERNSTTQAIKLLKSALGTNGHDATIYRILGTAYYNQNKKPLAELYTARSRFHAGNLKDSRRFALRARSGFKCHSRHWRIAEDIIKYRAGGDRGHLNDKRCR